MSEEIIKHLQLVAGAAEALILQATGIQEQFNPESYEVSAFHYLKLAKALQDLEDVESNEKQSKVTEVSL